MPSGHCRPAVIRFGQSRLFVSTMTSRARQVVLCLLTLLVAGLELQASAQPKTADDVILDSKDWSTFYRAYKRYGKESDGVVAGAFTDAASNLLAEQWALLDELQMIGNKDERFMKFVISNINEAVPANRAQKIRDHATSECADTNKALCRRIVRRIDQTGGSGKKPKGSLKGQ